MDITISFTQAQIDRLRPAIREAMKLDHDPSLDEAKDWMRQRLRSLVFNYEHRQSLLNISPPTDFDPT